MRCSKQDIFRLEEGYLMTSAVMSVIVFTLLVK